MPNPSAASPEQTPAGNDQRQGAFIAGGEFHSQVVGYQAIYTEEQAYTVAGLPNPYLGLRAFTAADRDIFAGRERMVQALVRRLAAEDGDRLLFLVGASGSGKSSLARAGLLPALEARLRELGHTVETHILDRPGHAQIAALAQLPPVGTTPVTTLLLIDQFEELWGQAGPDEVRHMLDFLLDLGTKHDHPLRIIATLRSDFFHHLAADARFEPYLRSMALVQVMSADELKDAIQRPVQVHCPGKCLEPALVEQLAQDAAQDAAYLPLLQVTLEDLWRGGSLRRGAYTELADAIQRRAETVYAYRDHDTLRQELRTSEEQQVMLSMLLDLVRVAPGEEQRETRWRRTRAELAQANPLRERLIADLTTARLLRTDRETEADGHTVETIDLIHEALLSRWERLKQAIEAERERLRQRERFLLSLQEWKERQRDDYLLSGMRLAEAEALRQQSDSVFHDLEALLFYEHSIRLRDRVIQDQIRRSRLIIATLSILIVLLLGAVGLAIQFGRESQQRAVIADSRRLAAEATTLLNADGDSEQSLLLSIEAVQINPNPATRQILQQSVTKRPYYTHFLSGHTKPATSAVFSPDGKHILTASTDGTAGLWKLDGTRLFSFQGHRAGLTSAIFSPDGKYVLTASLDGTGRLWEVDGTFIVSFKGHTDVLWSAVFSPDGKYILTASDDNTARLWKRDSTLLTSFQGHTSGLRGAVFSPDGKYVLTASTDKSARLWRLDGTLVTSFQGHSDLVANVVFSADGTRILTASEDRTARLWNLDGTLLTSFQGHTAGVNTAVFSPDEKSILTGSSDGTARLWTLDGTLLASFQGRRMPITSAVFSQDGKDVLTAYFDGPIGLWNLTTIPQSFRGHTSDVNSAVFSSDGKHIITASDDKTARLWNTDGTLLTSFQGHTSTVTSAVMNSEGDQILTASNDKTARLWKSDGTLLTSFQGHSGRVNSAVFSPDEKRVLTVSVDKTARLWKLDGTLLASFQGHTRDITSAFFSPDGRSILTASNDNTARLWGLDGTLLISFQGHSGRVTSAVFSPDGKHILTTSTDKTARLWNLDGTLQTSLQGHTDTINTAAFSSDGKSILTTSNDNTARLWKSDGTLLVTFQGHTSSVTSAVFSPDEKHILTLALDRTVKLWQVDGTLLTSFQGHTNVLTSVVFSPDGKRFLTASVDKTALLWPIKLSDWLLAAKCRVNHTLTATSLHDYEVPTPLAFDDTALAQRQCPPVYSWEQ